MRVPASPHNLRKFVATPGQSDSENSDGEVAKPQQQKFQRSRERTRMSAVQRLVERRMAQKEKEREKERDQLFRRSSSVGSAASRIDDNDKYHLARSLSRDRLNQDPINKTYIKISSSSSSAENNKNEILNKYCSPLKSTELFKDISNHGEKKEDDKSGTRKISFTTEKTILINDNKMRKVSIDINYVYEQEHTSASGVIQDEHMEPSKRRVSLEKRFQERQQSMSTSSSSSSTSSENSSISSTPEPMPRQSKQRKMSSRNINIILEDEISNETSERKFTSAPGLNLPQPKTSFHRRFSQDHSSMAANVPISPVRKISLQNNTTINTDR